MLSGDTSQKPHEEAKLASPESYSYLLSSENYTVDFGYVVFHPTKFALSYRLNRSLVHEHVFIFVWKFSLIES